MRVALISKPGFEDTGVGRYTGQLRAALAALGHDVVTVHPSVPLPGRLVWAARRLPGWDLNAFFNNYPIWARYPQADLYHITTQTMATLLWLRRPPGPTVITVHDIIPRLVRDDPELRSYDHRPAEWFDRLALAGLRHPEAIIAVSDYTRRTIMQVLGIPPDRIHVVYETVDRDRFRPLDVPQSFRDRYRLEPENRYILYVGSEDPRKNLSALIRAFAEVKQKIAHVKLLKVGAPHFHRERQRLLALVADLGLQNEVLFLEQVPDDELPLFYGLADVLAMPSLYEGFGLPVLEAMACGTPVVCSDATSLPEVAGTAALLVSPRDPSEMAAAIVQVLTDRDLASEMRRKGLIQAASFATGKMTDGLLRTYDLVMGQPTESRNETAQ